MPIRLSELQKKEDARKSKENTCGGIFINEYHKAQEREFEFGKISQICLGESGRGRKLLSLTCPEKCELKEGNNPSFTITHTKSGKWRISENTRHDLTQYLLLSSQGSYTRRGNGWIGRHACNAAEYELIAQGNGADGDAGRIGQWDVVLLKIVGQPQNDWLRIRRGGGGYGTDPEFLYVGSKGIFYFKSIAEMETFCEACNIEIPTPTHEKEKSPWKDVTDPF